MEVRAAGAAAEPAPPQKLSWGNMFGDDDSDDDSDDDNTSDAAAIDEDDDDADSDGGDDAAAAAPSDESWVQCEAPGCGKWRLLAATVRQVRVQHRGHSMFAVWAS